MIHYQEITCPICKGNQTIKAGRSSKGTQRYQCQQEDCLKNTFMLEYRYRACETGTKEKIIDMAINSAGIRDTARVLKIDKGTVINTLKKKANTLESLHPKLSELSSDGRLEVRLEAACEVEMDEQWSYVGSKSNQRWLWIAVDHVTNVLLAYVFGTRQDDVFKKLKALLNPYNIRRFYTDGWGAYERHLDPDKHEVGKQNTQKIERKNLNFRTWIKRLTRKTICFSKLEVMHDTVIGLLINKVEFGRDIYA